MCVKMQISCECLGGLVVREERGRMRLHQINFGGEHSEPHAFVSGFGTSDILSVTGRLGHCLLLVCSPRDHTGTEGKTISADRFSGIGAASVAGIREAHELGRICSTQTQLQITRAFEVPHYTFSSVPMNGTFINWLSFWMARAMSGCVAIVRYMRSPTSWW